MLHRIPSPGPGRHFGSASPPPKQARDQAFSRMPVLETLPHIRLRLRRPRRRDAPEEVKVREAPVGLDGHSPAVWSGNRLQIGGEKLQRN